MVSTIFRKMADIYNCQIGAWQRQFLRELFKAVLSLRGRVNFTNLARFSPLHEQTFRRHFQKAFQWVWFNLTVFRLRRHPEEPVIGVFDCSFLPKAGSKTWGLDRFFSSLAGRSKKGLEVSVLGIVATGSRRAFGVDATQTPSDLPTNRAGGYSRVDFYLEQIIDLYDQLAGLGVSYWVGDGFYAKQKVFDTVTDLGGDLITRLRSDANLRYLYTGPPKDGPGAPKQYDGKIDWDDHKALTRRFDEVGRLPDQPQVRILTTVANSPHFGRDLRVVLLIGPDGEEQVVLASTDTDQHAEEIARYYRLRYQIELAIRDAKQHKGLTHCQARSQEKLDFHLNMSLTAVNVLRLLAQKAECSPRTYRREAYNRLLIGRLFSKLGLSAEYDRKDRRVQAVVRTGRMAV
ncbi:transposase [Salinibacter sp.]|uniref:transposase n=1 Tax=Salinibacter sp. TaxID=2065818 RepID=UPI0021E74110|nr:transposase [Salinibacter sp.]